MTENIIKEIRNDPQLLALVILTIVRKKLEEACELIAVILREVERIDREDERAR